MVEIKPKSLNPWETPKIITYSQLINPVSRVGNYGAGTSTEANKDQEIVDNKPNVVVDKNKEDEFRNRLIDVFV